ncbi:MAG: stage III sporulation protein AA, partial [Acetatifactor sp.]|nr:stage III sporulation protein AA [Acetatifactor sp.]
MSTNLADIFPTAYRTCFAMAGQRAELVNEIRLRMNRPAILMEGGKEFFIRKDGVYTEHMDQAWQPDRQALQEIVSHLCQYSLYAYEDELKQGFLTVAGGHRVGISGQAVLDGQGRIRTIKNIAFVNIR